ncbi:MAG: hemolysin XhlA family protein [Defluviitaleaceae bacterium]|nr:hemolysin XhlA family protein [Defluviitaleaceae bacterium]
MNNEERIIGMLEQQQGMLNSIVSRLDRLETKVDNLETRMDNLEKVATETKERLIIMETDHGRHLTALYDGYKLLFDRMGRVGTTLEKIEINQEKYELMLKWHDTILKKTG